MKYFPLIPLYPYILLFLILLIFACDTNRVYEKNREIPESIWNVRDTVSFTVEIDDTISSHNFYINIRNTGIYSFSNLCLFVNTAFPDGRIKRDRAECILADKSGKWLGSGWGDIWSNQILFKKGVRFPQKGKYRFTFEQAQRYKGKAKIDNLHGIMDVGLRIEKADTN